MHASPRNSRHVRIPVTLICARTHSGERVVKSYAVFIPNSISRFENRRPMPHTSSTGNLRNTFSTSSGRYM